MTSFGGMKAAVSSVYNCTMLSDTQVEIVSFYIKLDLFRSFLAINLIFHSLFNYC